MKLFALLIAVAMCGFSCGPLVIEITDNDNFSDGYSSPSSVEYQFDVSFELEIEPPYLGENLERGIRAKADRAASFVALYLNRYLKLIGDSDKYLTTIRDASIEINKFTFQEGSNRGIASYSFDIAGPLDLMEKLSEAFPKEFRGENLYSEYLEFEFAIPGKAFEPEFNNFVLLYADYFLRTLIESGDIENDSFYPNTYEGPLQSIKTRVSKMESSDSYPEYTAFAEDGVYDVTVFFGYDFYDDRFDLIYAEQIFNYLKQNFMAPVDAFEEMRSDSGPFKKHVHMNGKEVTININLFHQEMFLNQHENHLDTFRHELRERDVVLFFGHFSDNKMEIENLWLWDRRKGISLEDIKNMDFDPHRKQLFYALGCRTYSQMADVFYANPTQTPFNRDVLTVVNLSYLEFENEFNTILLDGLSSLVKVDNVGIHQPQSYNQILRRMTKADPSKTAMYGIIGGADNPRTPPGADTSIIGTGCNQDKDCGSYPSHMCVPSLNSCATVSGGFCPNGYKFSSLNHGICIDP